MTMSKRLCLLLTMTALLLSACDEGGKASSSPILSAGDEIIGGEAIEPGDPREHYVVKLEVDVGNMTYFCTATHVTETVLITAAHCFPSKNTKDMRLIYRAGNWFGDSRMVKKIVPHPAYPRVKNADIAYIQIYGLMPDGHKILPLNFERPREDIFNILSIGFGITNARLTENEAGSGVGILRAVQTRVTGYSMNRDTFNIDMSKGKGVNGGDSGGPAIYMLNGQPTILGIARSIDFHQRGKTRVFDSVGYYTALSAHKDWVLRTLSTFEKF